MGYYSECLNKQFSLDDLSNERKKQLKKISTLRKREILVYASDMTKGIPGISISIDQSDVLPFLDQLSNVGGNEIDIILETPGGYAEIVEDLVKAVRGRFDKVGIIVPGTAKSAGTIFTMAADEILLGSMSCLGPIDAQIAGNGKRFSADAFLEGLDKIKKEAQAKKSLDIAYIPILQNISPGEIQHCENAQNFSKTLVTNWLKEYKFKFWEFHSSTGEPVSENDKEQRAKEIAARLCNHSHWLTHSRSIKKEDLVDMKLEITDYSKESDLNDAITKYYTLLKMTFETNIYKIYETCDSQIYRTVNTQNQLIDKNKEIDHALFEIECPKCKNKCKIQANFKDVPILPDALPFPKSNLFKCPSCGTEADLLGIRQNIEAQSGKKVL